MVVRGSRVSAGLQPNGLGIPRSGRRQGEGGDGIVIVKTCIYYGEGPCPPSHTIVVEQSVVGEVVAESNVIVGGKVGLLDTNNEIGGEKGAEGRKDVAVAGCFGGTGVSGVNGKGVDIK